VRNQVGENAKERVQGVLYEALNNVLPV